MRRGAGHWLFLLFCFAISGVTGFSGRWSVSKVWRNSHSISFNGKKSVFERSRDRSARIFPRLLSLSDDNDIFTKPPLGFENEEEGDEGTVYLHPLTDEERRSEAEKERRYDEERALRPWISDDPEDALVFSHIDHSDPLPEPESPANETSRTGKKLKTSWKRFQTPIAMEREEKEEVEGDPMPGWAESERDADPGDRLSWFDPGDLGYLDVRECEADFSQHYVALGVLETDRFREREMLWDYHLHWLRRSQLALYLSPAVARECVSGLCSVSQAYTALSYDRLTPIAQLLYISANSTEDVRRYLDREPLAGEGLLRWQLLRRRHNGDGSEDEIPRAPFLFLHLNHAKNNAETEKNSWTETFQKSCAFHSDAMLSKDATQRFDHLSRVISLSSLHSIPEPLEKQDEISPVCGQVMMFNAKSHADALRYIQKDPAGAALGAGEELMMKALLRTEDSTSMLVPINMIDCDGRARISYVTDDDYEKGVGIGDESPEELLYSTEYVFQDLRASEHFKENDRILDLLRREGVIIDVPESAYVTDEEVGKLKAELDEQCEPMTPLRVGEYVHFALEKHDEAKKAQAAAEAEEASEEEEGEGEEE